MALAPNFETVEIPDAAVEAAAKASYEVLASVWGWQDLSDSEKNMRRQRARAALVAAYLVDRVDALRPLLDREATTRAIEAASSRNDHIIGRTYVEAYADVFADAVMELARPMPTRKEIEEAISDELDGEGVVSYGLAPKLTARVMDLLNSES